MLGLLEDGRGWRRDRVSWRRDEGTSTFDVHRKIGRINKQLVRGVWEEEYGAKVEDLWKL